MHPEWRSIIEQAATQGLQQGMYTSGVMLTPESARWLADRLTWVVVSLDAADADSYATAKRCKTDVFDTVCRNLSAMATIPDIIVGISFMLREENWQRAPEMATLAQTIGATYATFRPAIVVDAEQPSVCTQDRRWIGKAIPTLRELAKRPHIELDVARFEAYQTWTGRDYDTCYGIRLSTTITPDGRVWACCQRRGIKDSCLGDLRNESFNMIWAKHPGAWRDFSQCRVMCRLHLMNETLAHVYTDRRHGAFL